MVPARPVAAAVDVRVRVGGSPGVSSSPAEMPKPALLWAVLPRIVWLATATEMPLSAFWFAVLPSMSAPPTATPSASNAPPSSEMPEPPVRLAMLFVTDHADAVAELDPGLERVGGVVAVDDQTVRVRGVDARRVVAEVAVLDRAAARVRDDDAAVGLPVREDAVDLDPVRVLHDHARVAVPDEDAAEHACCRASPGG